jgi:hypothetical protein
VQRHRLARTTREELAADLCGGGMGGVMLPEPGVDGGSEGRREALDEPDHVPFEGIDVVAVRDRGAAIDDDEFGTSRCAEASGPVFVVMRRRAVGEMIDL